MVPMYSSGPTLRNKLALLLYRMTITGKGSRPAYVRKVHVQIRLNGNWVQGERFSPRTEEPHNTVTLRSARKKDDCLKLVGWQDFQPGDKGLQYGQPSMFSAAAYFNIGERNFAQVDAVRIVVTDFLGSDY